jgi:hypothetical protein
MVTGTAQQDVKGGRACMYRHSNCCCGASTRSYGLADNEDNIPDIIRSGALQRLIEACDKLSMQASKVWAILVRMRMWLSG